MWAGGRGRRRRRHRIPYITGSDHDNGHQHYRRRRRHRRRFTHLGIGSMNRYWIIIASSALIALITPITGNGSIYPTWRDAHSSLASARNIRQLPCVSRRTGETGLCMFAYSCAKANGTHLGTCIDRFYFGSCCKIPADSDPDLLAPVFGNQLGGNHTDAGDVSSVRPSSLLPADAMSSSFPSLPTSFNPSSSLPSSTNNFYTSPAFLKTTSSETTSFDSVTVSSRAPSPSSSSYVTTAAPNASTAPNTPKPSSISSAKPATKPTFKPGSKPKPKPGAKPKPTKAPAKPATVQSSLYTPVTYPTTNTTSKPFHQAPLANTRPSTVSEATTVPTKFTSKPTPGVPTPITVFTSTNRPATSSKPHTTNNPPTSYIKIPITTMPSHSKPSTVQTSSTSHFRPDTFEASSFEPNQRFNISTVSTTDRPSSWQTASSSTSAVVTSTKPASVLWTTLDEAIIVPDRTKPTNMVVPSGKPPTVKPTFLPTFTKPSGGYEKPTTKPELNRPTTLQPVDNENQRPSSTMSTLSGSASTTSASWVELPVKTHAPTVSQNVSSLESAENVTDGVMSQSTQNSNNATTSSISSTFSSTASTTDANDIAPINMTNYKEVCGRRLFPTSRIVGGEKTSFGKWPWQISLRQWRTSTYLHKCGAALFNENWAVTAAHCVENVPPSDLLLRLGEHDLSSEDEPYGYQERRVQIVASHPQFDPRTFEYDLALLRFYEPVKFQPNIVPVCVPEDDVNFVGSQAWVTGWGRLYEDGPLPSILQEVSVPVINNSVCEHMYQSAGYIEHIPNIFICAGWRKGGFDSCEGDSGGPMVIQRPDKRWLLAGIISWGIGCAEPNQPGVYTRISEFREWINQILQF